MFVGRVLEKFQVWLLWNNKRYLKVIGTIWYNLLIWTGILFIRVTEVKIENREPDLQKSHSTIKLYVDNLVLAKQ